MHVHVAGRTLNLRWDLVCFYDVSRWNCAGRFVEYLKLFRILGGCSKSFLSDMYPE
jgi:hypothetical protein